MIQQDSEQYLQGYLTLPTGSPEPSPTPSANSRLRGGGPGAVWRVSGIRAKPETIQFIKKRELPLYQVHALTFETVEGQMWNYHCVLEQDEQGYWHNMASHAANREFAVLPTQDSPFIRLDRGYRPSPVWMTGFLQNTALHAHLVRLIPKNGQILEDIVQNDFVLFLTEQIMEEPIQVELYSHSNELIGVQTFHSYVTRPSKYKRK